MSKSTKMKHVSFVSFFCLFDYYLNFIVKGSQNDSVAVFSFAPEINGHNALNNHISSAQTSWNPFNSRTISPFKSLVQQNTETADLMEVEPSIWPGNTQSNHSTTVQAFSSFSDSMQMSRNTMSIENEENCPIYRPYNVIKITNVKHF